MQRLKICSFALLALAFSLPWLTPCTFGLGTIASATVNMAARPLAAQPLDYLPHPDLKQWAARPGPMLEVLSGKVIPRSLLIREEELARGSHKAPRPGSNMRNRAGNFVALISTLLAISDAASRGMLEEAGSDTHLLDDMPGSVEDQRRQLALCEFPFVLLQGAELNYLPQDKQPWPRIALASNRSKVTVITPDGTFIGIAQRIHFRSNSSEVILEGDPTVQSGQQHIKGARPDAIMKLEFAKRRVTVNGPVIEKKLFH
jgi:hypothetical protein